MKKILEISQFDYPLPQERIARYPIERRDESKLLVYKDGSIVDSHFNQLSDHLPSDTLLAFNHTKVVRARLILHKSTGARIEIFCLEPAEPSEYQSAFAAYGRSSWHCLVGNAKRFNARVATDDGTLKASKGQDDLVNFEWSTDETFGQILERLGKVPIPPYLQRESQGIDNERYQTAYASIEGSVAAPTAGLHFTPEMVDRIQNKAFVTLHVGAGTFLPVKEHDASKHIMHTESFEVSLDQIEKLAAAEGRIFAVGTTTVRTIESLATLGGRVLNCGEPMADRCVGQWESYPVRSIKPLAQWMRSNGVQTLRSSTQTMITPGYKFATIAGLITNFHQPRSTLLLLISAIVGDRWRDIYQHALRSDYRFLSYGDSSLLFVNKNSEL